MTNSLAPDLSLNVVVSDSLNENFSCRPFIDIRLDMYPLNIYITYMKEYRPTSYNDMQMFTRKYMYSPKSPIP